MELAFDPVEQLRTDGGALIDITRRFDASTPVSSCPGWTLGDLARHQAGVWTMFSRIVADRVTEPTDVQAVRESLAELGRDDQHVADTRARAHRDVLGAVEGEAPETVVWNWTADNGDVAWVRRRMAHETAVHRWDASDAVGEPSGLSTAVAADGIDEFLEFFLGRGRAEGAAEVDGTVHIHCTDTDETHTANGEWYVSAVAVGGVEFTREHRKGDAAVRGTAADVLLWLWRRITGEHSSVGIVGDESVAARFRAFPRL
ncbi:MAG: maleylpyruvate isomerase family mycothiol-dependent enzyme [Actinomycetota bacterium]